MHIKPLSRLLMGATVALALALATPAVATTDYVGPAYTAHDPSPAAIGGDALLVRPVSLAATVVGGGLFVIALPFALVTGQVDEAGQKLIVAPARYTFTRPLGRFDPDVGRIAP